MYKVLLFLLLFSVISVELLSQVTIQKKGRNYLYNEQTYSYLELEPILTEKALSNFYYKKAKKHIKATPIVFIVSTGSLVVGGGIELFNIPKEERISNFNSIETKNGILSAISASLITASIVGFVTGISLLKNTNKHKKKSIDLFNSYYAQDVGFNTIKIELGSTQNGLGVTIIF